MVDRSHALRCRSLNPAGPHGPLVLCVATGRYTHSPETAIEEDLARFADLPGNDSAAFAAVITSVIDTVFSPDYWTIRLPEDFVTSSTSASPAYQAYLAALNILDVDLSR